MAPTSMAALSRSTRRRIASAPVEEEVVVAVAVEADLGAVVVAGDAATEVLYCADEFTDRRRRPVHVGGRVSWTGVQRSDSWSSSLSPPVCRPGRSYGLVNLSSTIVHASHASTRKWSSVGRTRWQARFLS